MADLIKNIVFDFGGIVLTNDDSWLYTKEAKDLLKVSDEKLSQAWDAAWPDGLNGLTNEREYFQTFLEAAIGSTTESLINKFINLYREKSLIGPAYELLPKLSKGYHLFGLTNITTDWLRFKTEKFQLDKYFDLIISSCGEGIGKPHKEIYLALIKRGKIKPSESVLIDDLERNLIPARGMGFSTILFENTRKLVEDLQDLNIKI